MSADLAAVVLAAGAGTRLRPLTDLLPKPLCPVNDVALVDLALDRVRPLIPRVAVNVHHGRALLEAHLAGRVHLSAEEPEALGTAGALGRLRDWIAGRASVVVNADAWHRFDLSCLLRGSAGLPPATWPPTWPLRAARASSGTGPGSRVRSCARWCGWAGWCAGGSAWSSASRPAGP